MRPPCPNRSVRAATTSLAALLAIAATDAVAQVSAPTAPDGKPPPPPAVVAPATPTPIDERERQRAIAEESLRRELIPAALDAKRFAAFVAAIEPELAANAALLAAHGAYLAAHETLAVDPGREILRLVPSAYVFDAARETFVPRPTPELVRLLELREKAMKAAATAERALLREVSLATKPERRLQFARERIALARERAEKGALLSSTGASLLDLVARAKFSDERLVVVTPPLLAYADRLVALLDERWRLVRANEARRAEIETAAGTLWRYGAPERAAEVERALAALDDREIAAEVAIRALHQETLRRLRASLPRAEGRRLVELWQQHVHPELFDDERMLAGVIGILVALPGIAPEQNAAILDAVDAAYARMEPLAEEACAAADRILPRLLERTNAGAAGEIDARLSLLEVQGRRRAALRDAFARIRSLAAEAPADALARIEDLATSLASMARADDFERRSLEALQVEISDEAARAELEGLDDRTLPAEAGGNEPPASRPTGAGGPAGTDAAPPAAEAPSRRDRSSRGSRRQQEP